MLHGFLGHDRRDKTVSKGRRLPSLFPSVSSLLFFPKAASLSLTSSLTSKIPLTIPPHPSPPGTTKTTLLAHGPTSNATPSPTSFPSSTSPPETSAALSLPSFAASPTSPSSPSTTTPSTPPSPPISPRVRTSLGSASPKTSSRAPCPPPSPTSFFLLIHHLSRRTSGPDRRRTRRRERLELGEAGLEVGGEDGIGEVGAADREGRRKKEVKERGEEIEGKREGTKGKGEGSEGRRKKEHNEEREKEEGSHLPLETVLSRLSWPRNQCNTEVDNTRNPYSTKIACCQL